MRRTLFMFFSLLLMAVSGTAGLKTGNRIITLSPVSPNLYTIAEEIQDGKDKLTSFPELYKNETGEAILPVNDPDINPYLEKLLQRLLAKTSGIPFVCTIHVFSGEEGVGALTAPGCGIIIGTVLLENVPSESALAGIIAHELVHAGERHGTAYQTAETLMNTELKLLSTIADRTVAAALELSDDAIAKAAAIRELRKSRLNNDLASLAQSHENTADKTGTSIMLYAGFDPEALVLYFQSIAGNESWVDMLTAETITHPHPYIRAQNISNMTKLEKLFNGVRAVKNSDSPEFSRAKKRAKELNK